MSERPAAVVLAATAEVAGGADVADDPATCWAEASRSVMRTLVARVAGGRGLPAPCWGEGPAPVDDGLLADLGDVAIWSAPELGDVYEALLEAAPSEKGARAPESRSGRRRMLGAYYTPPAVAEALASFALGLPSGQTPAMVLDPACGAGVVLVQAARAIAARCQAGLLAQVIDQCIFGIDLDPVAVDLTKAALWLELDGSLPITCFDRNVICGDPLAGASPPHLEEQLPGMDPLAILGNPPYRDRAPRPATWPRRRRGQPPAQDLSGPDMDDFLPADGNGARGAEHLGNSYVYFWRWAAWKALESRMGAEGVVGLVTPSAWLTSRTFGGMRRHLRRWSHFGWVIDLSPEGHQPAVATRIFPGVQIQLCLGVFARLGEPDPHPALVRLAAVHGDREAKVRDLQAMLERVRRLLNDDPRPPGRGDHDMEVNPMEPRMIALDRIRILEGHNARGDVGDVSELADSIKALGVLQALTVVELDPEDGQPVYGLIAGERRLTAARQVGLAEVPCVVQNLDERQRVAAMLVENLQRQDLSVLEEARGIQRLADMGLNQREIARQLGRGQSHVSKRLALLTLPAAIQAAIDRPRDVRDRDSRGITVADALELARLADHPERQAEAFTRGRGWNGGIAETVTEHLRDLERERARAEARSRLMAAGVKILKEQEFYSWTGGRERPLQGQGHDHAAIGLTVEEHQGEPCLAAAIDRLGKVIFVCRDPTRHPDVDPRTAAQVVKARQEQDEQREDNRLRREASSGRRAAIERVLAGANTSSLTFAARQVTDHSGREETKVACGLLGLEPVEERHEYGAYRDYRAALSGYAAGSMAAAIRALLALALASGEATVGSTWAGTTELGKRHMEVLAAAGYQPNDSDRKHLTGEPDRRAAGGSGEEERVCRGCGCSEQEPCHGGCHWVDDPEELGDLCSRCVEDVDEEVRDAVDAMASLA